MGKWNRRFMHRPRRRNYYQDYDWSPPRDEPCPDPETEVWQDNVPLWEKKFCYLVGRMPWRKVLSTKNFMHCHSNVLNWDDSAGKEAFFNAKERFWQETNGLPCKTQLPNPDMYVDEIDWNPYIDPEMVRELDREYFNPDDKYKLPSASSSKGNKGWPNDGSNPWEHGYVQNTVAQDKATGSGWNQWDSQPDERNRGWESNNVQNQWDNWPDAHADHEKCKNNEVKDRTTGWNKCDNSVNDANKLNKDDNPWERCQARGNEVVTGSTWGGARDKAWDSKPHNQSDMSKNWTEKNIWRNERNGWQGHGTNSRSSNKKKDDFYKPNYLNSSYKPQGYGSHQGSRATNGRGSAWVPKRWDNHSSEVKDSGNISRDHRPFNASCRKREGSDHYATNHKGPRLQGVNSQSSSYWNGGNNQRVSFGGQWS